MGRRLNEFVGMTDRCLDEWEQFLDGWKPDFSPDVAAMNYGKLKRAILLLIEEVRRLRKRLREGES